MKVELKNLYDKKGKIVNEMQDAYRDVNKRGGVATPEEKAKFTGWDTELNEIQEQIDFHQRAAKLDLLKEADHGIEIESAENKGKRFNDKASRVERREALQKAKVHGYSSLSDSERIALDTENRDMKAFEKRIRGFNLTPEEQKIVDSYEVRLGTGQSVGTTTAGGYTVPEGFQSRVVEYMAAVSELTNWASILRTDSGQPIKMSINDDNSNTGELISELGDYSSSSADLVFSTRNLSAYEMSSKMIAVSAELIQDNGVNFVDYLAKKLSIRCGKVANTYYTTGSGSSQPKGFLQTRGAVTASTSTFTLAELSSFQDSIDPAYRGGANVAWSMHSNLLSELKALSIAATAYGQVWSPSFRDGEPDTILGKRYFINQAMSSTSATGDKIFAYGDWSKFIIRIVNDFTLKVSDQRYFEYNKTAFLGILRTDSFLEDTTAVKYMEIS